MGSAILPQLAQYAGGGGAIAALGLFVKYLAQAWQRRHDGKRKDNSSTITDAATTNAMLLAALKEERTDNKAKGERIDDLEDRVRALSAELVEQRETHDEQIRRARSEAERQIEIMREQIADLTTKLGQLQRQITVDLPSPDHRGDSL